MHFGCVQAELSYWMHNSLVINLLPYFASGIDSFFTKFKYYDDLYGAPEYRTRSQAIFIVWDGFVNFVCPRTLERPRPPLCLILSGFYPHLLPRVFMDWGAGPILRNKSDVPRITKNGVLLNHRNTSTPCSPGDCWPRSCVVTQLRAASMLHWTSK